MLEEHNEPMAWHHKLARAVRSTGLLDKEVAAAVGVTGSTMSDWLSGVSQPRYDKLIRLCEVLDVPVGFLFEGEAEAGTPIELAAWQSFGRLLRDRGPHAVLALLEGATSYARDLGEIPLPAKPIRHHKRPDRPRDPPLAGPATVPAPVPPSGPDQVDLDDSATGQHRAPPGPQRKRK